MHIATVVFTYNRSYHTEKTIEALSKNSLLPEKLFLFQDGLRKDSDRSEWKKVNDLIHKIKWCDTEIIVSNDNKGLSDSIISGINYVLKKYDAVIVLEDDCVPTANFISFMKQCFEKYKDNKKVYSISGYSWPIMLKKKQYDIYGCGRISSWGWGTWKDRWMIYEKNYEIIKKMKQNKELSRNLAIWGNDLEDTLEGNVKGVCDSWAVFWALNVILKQGICVNPYQSFIRNIGRDGSGVHCGISDQFEVECVENQKDRFYLPDELYCLSETMTAFAELYGSYTAISECTRNKKKVLVYGAGKFYLANEKFINQEYFIEKFIDIYKKGYFEGREIIKPDKIKNYQFEKLIIMIQDKKDSMDIFEQMIKLYNIPEYKIEIGALKYS